MIHPVICRNVRGYGGFGGQTITRLRTLRCVRSVVGVALSVVVVTVQRTGREIG